MCLPSFDRFFSQKSLSILHFHATGESKRIAINLLKIEHNVAAVALLSKSVRRITLHEQVYLWTNCALLKIAEILG
jgi:hypothetical protein